MNIQNKIIHNRKLTVIFNYAYDFVGQGLVSDGIYEYTLSTLRELKKEHPEEWNSCEFYKEYFVDSDDWEYTGSGVPLTQETKDLYQFFVNNGNTLYVAPSK